MVSMKDQNIKTLPLEYYTFYIGEGQPGVQVHGPSAGVTLKYISNPEG